MRVDYRISTMGFVFGTYLVGFTIITFDPGAGPKYAVVSALIIMMASLMTANWFGDNGRPVEDEA